MRIIAIAIGIGGLSLGFAVATFGLRAPKAQANNELPKLWDMKCDDVRGTSAQIQSRCENMEVICYLGAGSAKNFSCVRK